MTAFVMMPYSARFQKVYEEAIRPAIENAGLTSIVAKDEVQPGPIPEQIQQSIENSRVCVADLTGTNPNVVYEVALAHSQGKPVVLITQGVPSEIPFDIRHHRVIQYQETTDGLEQLTRSLTEALAATLEFGESPTELLRQMLVPGSLSTPGPYVVAASPLSFGEAYRTRGRWNRPLGTYADQLGIRNLMQSFGLIFGLDRLPALLDPDDFDNEVLDQPYHVYSVASPKANRLTGMIMDGFFKDRSPKWDFKPDPESSNLRNPKLLLRLDGKLYEPVHKVPGGRLVWDFGLVIRGPHPLYPDYMSTVLAGRSSRGTEASCLAATDSACLHKLKNGLEEENLDLDNHRDAFCAVVSIAAETGERGKPDARLGPDASTFRVEDLSTWRDSAS